VENLILDTDEVKGQPSRCGPRLALHQTPTRIFAVPSDSDPAAAPLVCRRNAEPFGQRCRK